MRLQLIVPGLALLAAGATANAASTVDRQDPLRVSEDLRRQGRLSEARQVLEDAIATGTEGRRDEVARIYNDLGSLAQDQGNYRDADRYYRRSIALWNPAGALSQLGLARTLNNLSSLLWTVGREREAESLLERSAGLHARFLGSDHPEAALVYSNLGTMRLRRRRWAEAGEAFRHSLKNGGKMAPGEIAWIYYSLGVICQRTHRSSSEAGSWFRQAQSIWEPLRSAGRIGPEHLLYLAVSYRHTGQPAGTDPLLRQAIGEIERAGAPARRKAYLFLACAAEFKRTPHRDARARNAEAKALEARARQLLADDEQFRMFAQTIHVNGLLPR